MFRMLQIPKKSATQGLRAKFAHAAVMLQTFGKSTALKTTVTRLGRYTGERAVAGPTGHGAQTPRLLASAMK